MSGTTTTNDKVTRNWKQVEDDLHIVEFVNRHSGNRIGIRNLNQEEIPMGVSREKNYEVDLPDGYLPGHYESFEQARDFLVNWMREHPAGGAGLGEVFDMSSDLEKSPLSSEDQREKKQRVFNHLVEGVDA